MRRYGSELGDWGVGPEVGDLVINEVLADPPTGADVNGDGTASIDADELVEIVNRTAIAIRFDGLELSDDTAVRHASRARRSIAAGSGSRKILRVGSG